MCWCCIYQFIQSLYRPSGESPTDLNGGGSFPVAPMEFRAYVIFGVFHNAVCYGRECGSYENALSITSDGIAGWKKGSPNGALLFNTTLRNNVR